MKKTTKKVIKKYILTTVNLTKDQMKYAKDIGNGSRAKGVRLALNFALKKGMKKSVE